MTLFLPLEIYSEPEGENDTNKPQNIYYLYKNIGVHFFLLSIQYITKIKITVAIAPKLKANLIFSGYIFISFFSPSITQNLSFQKLEIHPKPH